MKQELTDEQKVLYKSAISKGFFDDYSLVWRTTKFMGVWLWKHPERTRVIEIFIEILGRNPEWKDLTDINLRLFSEILQECVCQNSARTICAELKSIIGEYHDDMGIPSAKYKKILNISQDASESVYLTLKELNSIRDFRRSNANSDYDNAIIDVFMIEALTGARHIDSERLTLDNVNTETSTLHYVAKKTKKEVQVPAHNWLLDYLPKNQEELEKRPKICLMTFNRSIRRICKRCGITKNITLYRRGKEMTLPKFEFVSSHTARRSFATNLSVYGAEIGLVSQLMGHSSTEMTLRYIKEKAIIPEKIKAYFCG